MKIMSVNAGSSTLKFSLFDMEREVVITTGNFERIGTEASFYTIKYNGEKLTEEVLIKDHLDAANILLAKLLELNIINSYDEIDGVGHRVVHGGPVYSESVLVTDKVIEDIARFADYAPLHNLAHVMAINAFKEALPNTPMAVVFDTAFHQTMDKASFLYPLPYAWYEKYGVRRYGAHGTSHRYVSKKISEVLGRDDLKVIVCHLGNGGSLSAVKNGKCINTSMGFTPLAGIMMGTRSGDIDPSIIPYVMEKEGKTAQEVINDLNKKSGYLGVSELSADARDIEDGIKAGNEKCILAQEMYVKTVVKYIANYYVELGGADVICFTAGIGEKGVDTRAQIIEKLACLGIYLDEEANNTRGELIRISTEDSKVAAYVVPTDEELMIARDTLELINR